MRVPVAWIGAIYGISLHELSSYAVYTIRSKIHVVEDEQLTKESP